MILKSWTSDERFSHHGKFWHFENIIVEPPTAQKPHPPIWMAAGSPDSIRKVARRGAKLLLDQFASIALDHRALQHLQGRGRGAGPALRPDGCRRRRAFFVAKDAEEKAQGGRDAARQPAAPGRGSPPRPAARASRACCRSTRRSTRPTRARCSARRTRSRRSSTCCARPASSICCSTARPARRETCARFAREVMPALRCARERPRRAQPHSRTPSA